MNALGGNIVVLIYETHPYTKLMPLPTMCFGGNPAAVCILDNWLDSALMQKIAQENNLAETAFVVQNNAQFEIRWFTPETEVALCGHATLASAYALFNYYSYPENTIRFYSRKSGALHVENGENGFITLDFPADDNAMIRSHDAIEKALGWSPIKTIKGKTDYLLIYNSQAEIEALEPNFHLCWINAIVEVLSHLPQVTM